MKKIKYLLGLLIVGVGLLFNNNSFGLNWLNLELVTLPWNSSNYQSSSARLFHSNVSLITGWPSSCGYIPFLNSSIYVNGSLSHNWNLYYVNNRVNIPLFNSSYLGYIPSYGARACSSVDVNSNMIGTNELAIYLGQSSDFGNNFVGAYIDNWTQTGYYGPVYGFGKDFYSVTSNYAGFHGDSIPSYYWRFFYEQIPSNLADPLDSFNYIALTGTYQTGSIGYEYFTSNYTVYQTKFNSSSKYIIDYGREGRKGLHFGGYGMGYTFAVDFTQDNSTFYWGNWSFSSIGSRCIESAMKLGLTDFDTLTSNNCSSLGLLVLKGDSYVTKNNNSAVIVLGKDPTNTKRVLYEQFDCADDDLLRIMDTDSSFCNSLGHGYITINNSTDVLPFENKQVSYTLGNGNPFIDFFFSDGIYGNVTHNDSEYCLAGSSKTLCFGLQPTSSLSSLKEIYLQNSGSVGGIGGTVSGPGLNDIIINNPSSYYTYSGLLNLSSDSVFYSGFNPDSAWSDGSFLSNGLGYSFVNGVPTLTEYHFGFCPFTSIFGQVEPTMSYDGFSFDLLRPFKCVLYSFQYGFLNLNTPFLDSLQLNNLLISDVNLSTFVWIVLYGGLLLLLFRFISKII